ncbi:MAG: HU family DNA-binding protein [Nitrospinota bacterium]|nr:HU family DNA-binding protein [Nitrospinota bacterium]
MNKSELIEKMAKDSNLSKGDSEKALNAFIGAVQGTLKKGNGVTLVGFGTFSVAKRAARVGLNPQTREKIKIPAKKVPKFKPGQKFKDAVSK